MHKHVNTHPAFQRLNSFIEDQVLKMRPSAIKIATDQVLAQGLGLTQVTLPRRIAELVTTMEARMVKKLGRYYNIQSRYVGH